MWVAFAGVDGDNRSEKTEDTIEAGGDTSTSTTVGSGEHFRSVSIQDTVHDVLEEGLETSADKLDVWVGGEGEAVDDDTSDHGGDSHGTLTPNIWKVDSVASEDGTWNTNDGSDCVVSVDFKKN